MWRKAVPEVHCILAAKFTYAHRAVPPIATGHYHPLLSSAYLLFRRRLHYLVSTYRAYGDRMPTIDNLQRDPDELRGSASISPTHPAPPRTPETAM